MVKQITISYQKNNSRHEFLIHNVGSGGSWHLLKKEPWGYSPVIKPNGTFCDEALARMVLAYIETVNGYEKTTETETIIAE